MSKLSDLMAEDPALAAEVEKMQKEMAYHMLATFAEAFRNQGVAMQEGRRIAREALEKSGAAPKSQEWHGTDLAVASPDEMEAVLSATVLKEFKIRLDRIGLEYQTPVAP